MGLLDFLFRRKPPAKIPITNPTLGQLNLMGQEAEDMVTLDRDVLAPLFGGACAVKTDEPPKCDVLLVYARFKPSGGPAGSSLGWRELIPNSGAKVVIFATDNDPDNFPDRSSDPVYGRVNVVLTLQRKGEDFAEFFRQLFSLMFDGESMPDAWCKLAPQISGLEHEGGPEAVFGCLLGDITFKENA
ncbi:MAG: hypothetical protein AAF492_24660 [Verrucomicrobiota bacterium]